MSCGTLRRLLASFAAALSLAAGVAEVRAGGCGCEAPPCQTVVRYKHHCHKCPPVGIVVPSMPVMPMMVMPMMMAPAMPVAAASYPVPVAAPPVAAPTPTCMTQDQLVRALSAALAREQGGVGAGSLNMSTDERLADLERRVSRLESQTKSLEGNTKDIVEILKAMKQKLD